ncbi:MAG TPA: hypothetical protein VLT84_01180 [Acidobacteriota bacterium]|nr:hypothetical protein [Acidobacteriota bacterium]
MTDKSEEKLAGGNAWEAWRLATRALQKEPGNPRAREAATAAGAAIADEYQRRIRALAEVDSLAAAEQVLELAEFRGDAARYATIPVGGRWPGEEQRLRQTAARIHYQRGVEAARSARPKRACAEFDDANRYVAGYRDVAKRSDEALSKALARVAVVPFRSRQSDASFGAQISQAWRDNLAQTLVPPTAAFTRVIGDNAIERTLTLDQLESISRDDAIRLGRKSGAQRVVWGSVGAVNSKTRLQMFDEPVARKVVTRDEQGVERLRWVEVPIQVVARVRDVTVGLDYEIISVTTGATLAHRRVDRSTSARVVWTSHRLDGEPSSYSLVSEEVRQSNPKRARDVESRWESVCGAKTTLVQVLEARRAASRSGGRYARESLPRFAAGAAFVFLEELPPAEDLALTVLADGYAPLRDDLLRLDPIDDVDLGMAAPGVRSR